MKTKMLVAGTVTCAALIACEAYAQEPSEKDLARKTQNPISDLISVPFQNNTDFRFGPNDRTRDILNIQPVWPFKLNEDWNLITRTIAPLITVSEAAPGEGATFGLGDVVFSAWLSPRASGPIIWGFGGAIQFPTATEESFGTERWSAGPSLVVLTMNGPWVYGGLIQNIWSFAGTRERADVNQMLLQPFVNFNLSRGWYLVTAPIITAQWEAEKLDDRWTVPVGAGVGKILRLFVPLNLSAQYYYNVETPKRTGAMWQLRLQLQLLFPK